MDEVPIHDQPDLNRIRSEGQDVGEGADWKMKQATDDLQHLLLRWEVDMEL